MKQLIIALLILSTASVVQAQINILRYNDYFDRIKPDSVHGKGFEHLKHIPVSRKMDVSFGGELREQFQYYQNRNFGNAIDSSAPAVTIQLLHRFMAHANIELDSNIRLFAQLGSTFRFFNPGPLTPEIDENRLSLHQAFLDWHFHSKWMVRLGRQELKYGSHRLITFREGPNNRLSFDGLILMHHAANRKVAAFALSPVTSKPGVLDDQSLEDILLGVYIKDNTISRRFTLEYYAINFVSERRSYNYQKGQESRQSYGVRILTQNPKLNGEAEATYQSGKFNDLNISAYSISLDLNYKPVQKSSLVLGLSMNYISGDKNSGDKQLNTYNLLYSKPQFGLTAPIGSSNIINLNPYVVFTYRKRLKTNIGVYWMWRQSNRDGIYSPLATTIRSGQSTLFTSTSRTIGTQLSFEAAYSVNQHLSFSFDAGYFYAGKYIKETGSEKNITYLSFKGSFKF